MFCSTFWKTLFNTVEFTYWLYMFVNYSIKSWIKFKIGSKNCTKSVMTFPKHFWSQCVLAKLSITNEFFFLFHSSANIGCCICSIGKCKQGEASKVIVDIAVFMEAEVQQVFVTMGWFQLYVSFNVRKVKTIPIFWVGFSCKEFC